MTDEEYRALVAAGPAVVMVAKEDMLKLLERLIIAEQELSWLVSRYTICDND